MEKEHLYTVITEIKDSCEFFIHQLRTTKTHPGDILLAWGAQAVAQGLIKKTEDSLVSFRSIVTDKDDLPDAFEGGFNVWRIIPSMGMDFVANLGKHAHYTVDFIKTSASASVLILPYKTSPKPPGSRLVRRAEAKYIFYEERYTKLKDAHVLTNAIDKERKQAEHWMTYWDAKRKLYGQPCSKDNSENKNSLHTIIMYYRGGTYLKQFSNMLNNDAKQILLLFATNLFQTTYKTKILTPSDRALLMGKLSQDVYTPLPVVECINVWSTYCSLSEDVATLFIIKTALDE